MLDEMTIRALAAETLDPKGARLFVLVLYGDAEKGIPPARDPDKITWPECSAFAKALGCQSHPEWIRPIYHAAETAMRPVLAAAAPTVPIVRYEPPAETEPDCNIILQRGHHASDSFDYPQGYTLGLPNLRARPKTY
jgi:hypothetical protein